jgi:hypothetical protein
MPDAYSDVDSERLRALVTVPRAIIIFDALAKTACAGVSPEVFHPEAGRPPNWALGLCAACPSRLPCLAFALRTEPTDQRHGWYGGLGPAERGRLAAHAGLTTARQATTDRATESVRLRAAGWPIGAIASHLRCSRRTVQRYLRPPIAGSSRRPRAHTDAVAASEQRADRGQHVGHR